MTDSSTPLPTSPEAGPAVRRSPYLKRLKIVGFGSFSNKVVGPFSPRLNVVYGRNESGKTTLAAFVGGVLFGWEEARGGRNTYKPVNADRAGSLFFATDDTESDGFAAIDDERELSRLKNSDGLIGDASLVEDIDRETFRTMFSLTSDELRSLRNTTDVTAKLLTAGSGTGASPTQALADVQARLAEHTSRASGVEHSLVRLALEQDDLRSQLAEAAEETERFKHRDKEFHEIAPQRSDLLARLTDLNTVIETLTVQRSNLEKLDHEIADLSMQLDALREDERDLTTEHRHRATDVPRVLVDLGHAEERTLRDRLDTLAVEQAKYEHAVDLAEDNYATSKAAYEALLEADDTLAAEGRARRQRRVQLWLSILLPLMFVASGVPVFMHGREINSLSFTALGIGLVVFALLLACAALVMLFRPDRETEAFEARKQDAQWVMLQDRRKLESCREARAQQADRVRSQLDAEGLDDAAGSIRRARALLDEAKDVRADEGLFSQHRKAIVSRRSALEANLATTRRQRDQLIDRLAIRDEPTLEAIDRAIAQKTRQRADLMEASERLNRRYGELKQELSQARRAHRFDELKLRYQQVRTRQEESTRTYASLLLAKRMLELSIAAWESKSQPEVYRQASRLLSLMTDGRWVKVAMTAEGKLQVTDTVRTKREPAHLSLGTCQQLYLALRIALLLTAENVGRSVPILADDILVNFDSSRRRGAAVALAELARSRQVIMFTCHEEIVETLRAADSSLNEVEL